MQQGDCGWHSCLRKNARGSGALTLRCRTRDQHYTATVSGCLMQPQLSNIWRLMILLQSAFRSGYCCYSSCSDFAARQFAVQLAYSHRAQCQVHNGGVGCLRLKCVRTQRVLSSVSACISREMCCCLQYANVCSTHANICSAHANVCSTHASVCSTNANVCNCLAIHRSQAWP